MPRDLQNREGGDVVQELVTDHREVEELFRLLLSLSSGDTRRREVADQVTMELVRHSVAEEAYLYPSVRRFLDNGDELADKELADHARAERLMRDLEDIEADDPRFDRLITQLLDEVNAHFQDEELRLFPALHLACPDELLAAQGAKIRQARKAAPTRSHPIAPDKPPANRLLAPGTGLRDLLRDLRPGRKRK
ncbi:hemerythrin domain-containing protein [Streptomyces chryseus]